MKTKEEIEEMYEVIGYFNDGRFMNKDYRKGIMDGLSFILYKGETLERIKCKLSTFSENLTFSEKKKEHNKILIQDSEAVCKKCWRKGQIQKDCPDCKGTGKES